VLAREPDSGSKSDQSLITNRKIAVLGEYLLDWAQDQNAGGGRMNCVEAGRKIAEASATEIASTAVAKTGADATV